MKTNKATTKDYKQPPRGFFTEAAARKYARENLANTRLQIIQSEHSTSIFSFWIDGSDAMVRSWERVAFTGGGDEA